MTVHVDSKIDLWVNTFHPDFYASITDKENWVFLDKAGDVDALAAWHDYFTDLMVKINAWRAATYASRSDATTKNIINVLFTYKMYGTRYNTDMTQVATTNALNIYDIGGFIPLTIARPVDSYNDMELIGYTSVLMDADLATLEPAVWQLDEAAKVTLAITNAQAPALAFGQRSMFEAPPVPVANISKQQLATFIFIDQKFKHIKDNIPGVLGIEVPAFIT